MRLLLGALAAVSALQCLPLLRAGIVDLSTSTWIACGRLQSGRPICMDGRVPGDIYTDAHRNGLIDDPMLNDNDVRLRWLGESNWTTTIGW